MNDYFEAVLDRQAPGTLAVIVQQGHIRVSYIADDLPPWYSFAPMDPRDNMTAVIESALTIRQPYARRCFVAATSTDYATESITSCSCC